MLRKGKATHEKEGREKHLMLCLSTVMLHSEPYNTLLEKHAENYGALLEEHVTLLGK